MIDLVTLSGFTPGELADAAPVLRRVLAQVAAGDLTMSDASRRRLEGAIATLEALTGLLRSGWLSEAAERRHSPLAVATHDVANTAHGRTPDGGVVPDVEPVGKPPGALTL